MLSKCANPECSASFRYLQEGKLYRLEALSAPDSVYPSGTRSAEYFWLCAECAAKMSLHLTGDGSVSLSIVPEPLLPDPGQEVVSLDHQRGLLLCRMNFCNQSGLSKV